jgi:hypothetical protein
MITAMDTHDHHVATDAEPEVGWAQTSRFPPGYAPPRHTPAWILTSVAVLAFIVGGVCFVLGWMHTPPVHSGGTLSTTIGTWLFGIGVWLWIFAVILGVVAIVARVVEGRTRR